MFAKPLLLWLVRTSVLVLMGIQKAVPTSTAFAFHGYL
jgi:hypothetical protein